MYNKLRETIDALPMVDDHNHLGFTVANDEMPKEARVGFRDAFATPKQSSSGFAYQENLHREAYIKIYGLKKEEIDDEAYRAKNSAIYEKARTEDIDKTLTKIMEVANVEKVLTTCYLPNKLKHFSKLGYLPLTDFLMFPFNNDYLRERQISAQFVNQYEYILHEAMRDYHLPVDYDFNDYLSFVNRVLDDFHQKGYVGYKFLLPYVRSLRMDKEELTDGPKLFKEAKEGNIKSYHRFQNLIGWLIARKAAQNGMPIQIHTALIDPNLDYADPLGLEPFLHDAETYQAKIVMLHVGYPTFSQALTISMAANLFTVNNLYPEISGRFIFGNHPKIVAKELRRFLDFPILWKKITFGSDALTGDRYFYTGSRTGRDAVYYCLEGMIDDGIVSEEVAIGIAKDILRNNAIRLYNLDMKIL